ncbi:MAG: IS200/IS605 family transposase [Planctomycetaceae bacterium]|jgi:REP element-mobilizing transposase RayT|nr:IS200/IS605 family transposase [Planctomycetaceae bacterium]
MPQSLSQIYLHIVFSTKQRKTFIDATIEPELFNIIGGIIKKDGGVPFLINGTEDHVHILSGFPKSMTLSDFIRNIKHGSSVWIKTKGNRYRDFAWQNGYGAFSVSSSKIKTVKDYIAKQKEHHKKETLEEELAKFFKQYNLDYNSKYYWD